MPEELFAQEPPFRPLSFTESMLIKVNVEGDPRTFQIHKERLVSKSGYFRGLLRFNTLYPVHMRASSTTATAAVTPSTSEIVLQKANDHDADVFANIADWFYEGRLALASLEPTDTSDLNGNRRSQVALTKVYIEADKLSIPALKNDVVDIIKGFSYITLPSLRALQMVREAIPIPTMLERFFMDCMLFWMWTRPDFLDFNENGWHLEAAEVLREDGELCFEIFKTTLLISSDVTRDHPCEMTDGVYHEHGQGAPVVECESCEDKQG